MQNRYSLRFDSGERQGETVPLSGRGFLIGRKPGSSLQIVDGSVSGRHAEIDVDDTGVLIRDLGSTNGTRVGSNRVIEERLAHGDQVLFGNVQLTFLDAEFGAAPPAVQDEPEVDAISAEKLARAGGRRSLLSLGLVVVLLGVLAGVWYFSGKSTGAVRTVQPVVAVPGDLLDDGAFEGDGSAWTAHEASLADFLPFAGAAHTGETGLRAVVEGEEWALCRSEPVAVRSPGAVVLRAALRADAGARVRAGVEFLRSDGEGGFTETGSQIAWSAPRTGTDGFDAVEVPLAVPAGFAKARAVLFAAGDGAAAADDVSLVSESSAPAPDFRVGEFELRLLGEDDGAAVLHKVDRFLLSDLRAPLANAPAALGGPGAPLRAEAAGEEAVRLSFEGSRLRFAIEPDALENGVATIGEGGYQLHSADFEREQVRSLLVGVRRDLVRLKFASPVTLRARPAEARLEVTVEGVSGDVLLQLDFREERVAAGNLAYEARKHETEGRFGPAIATWTKLLDDHPYESALVAEAEEVVGRLSRAGLEEVQAVREELARGSFFRLVEIYWQCRDDAAAIAESYAGTSVAEAALEVVGEVERDVAGLERDLQSHERTRLAGIRHALEAGGSPALAAEVGRYLDETFGEDE